tara:strand:+ start:4083 stop:4661 length:579 start_codon:yes stop_codon:yes gene_type:complete
VNFFIEIGSCDFDTLLPLAKNGWYGIIVEPVSEYLNNLETHPNVIFENSAISTYDGETEFYYYDPLLSEKINKQWVRGIGSYNNEINGFVPNPQWKDFERKTIVKTMTLDSLIKKYSITQIDFLKIDVEGCELPIVLNYSWDVLPKVIKMETTHWESTENYYNGEIKQPILYLLEKNGYIIWEEEYDLYAIR